MAFSEYQGKVLNGKEFKEIFGNKFYKYLDDNLEEDNSAIKYKIGLNEIILDDLENHLNYLYNFVQISLQDNIENLNFISNKNLRLYYLNKFLELENRNEKELKKIIFNLILK